MNDIFYNASVLPEIQMRLMALSLFVIAALPAVSGAQQATAATGPTLQSAAVGFHDSRDASAKSSAAPAVHRGAGQDVALMAVGVGAMIVGALVAGTAGTIIVIAGAGMALFGLYHYLE